MKKLVAINVLQYCVGSALLVILPLLLIEREINLAIIGAVLSVAPFVFMIARIVFAAIADQTGVKPFFLLGSAANSCALLAYLTATSPGAFALGKFCEGIKDSGFWAVVRTAVITRFKKSEQVKNLSSLSGARALAVSAGMAGAGFLIKATSFEVALAALFAVSLIQFIPSLAFEERQRAWSASAAVRMIFAKRSATFWRIALALSFNAVTSTALLMFVFPVFMKKELGLGYEQIGLALAGYYLLSSISTFTAVKAGVRPGRAVILAAFFFVPSMSLLWAQEFFFPLLALAAAGSGLASVGFESLVVRAAASRTASTDVGLLHIPYRLVEFSSVMAAGVIAQNWGFQPVFAACALAFLIFSLAAVAELKKPLGRQQLFLANGR